MDVKRIKAFAVLIIVTAGFSSICFKFGFIKVMDTISFYGYAAWYTVIIILLILMFIERIRSTKCTECFEFYIKEEKNQKICEDCIYTANYRKAQKEKELTK